jgi:uncharacterized Zn finger protein (UPF0148 family)
MTCARCNNWLMKRNEDGDMSCFQCGHVVYASVFEEMRPGTDGARFSIKREPRHDSPNKLKQGTLR